MKPICTSVNATKNRKKLEIMKKLKLEFGKKSSMHQIKHQSARVSNRLE
jgi:hypothetical protein